MSPFYTKQLLLYILLLFATVCSFAQKEPNLDRRKIMFLGETHLFTLLPEHSAVKKDQHVIYHWYKLNAIHQSEGDYDGYLLHGEYIIYSLSNDLKEKGNYSKGRKDGIWKTWYSNGRLKEIYTWKKGMLNGPYQSFDSLGQSSTTGQYKNNLEHGKFTTYYNGAITYTTRYKNGKVVPEKISRQKRSNPSDSLMTPEPITVEQTKADASTIGNTIKKKETKQRNQPSTSKDSNKKNTVPTSDESVSTSKRNKSRFNWLKKKVKANP